MSRRLTREFRRTLALVTLMVDVIVSASSPEPEAGVWMPDQGNKTYFNPVLAGDYSDPDVVRVGNDYYMTASSFTNVPGLPILHSRDLVNWTIIGHALPRLVPDAHYATPRHGGGVWAPTIRYFDGQFRIYFPDPDFGIYVMIATNPAGPWSAPVLIDVSKGAIDPAPFRDDDGRMWLVNAWAGSRAGFNNVISLKELSSDGLRVIGPRRDIVIADQLPPTTTSQGPKPWFITEGPKLYKRNGWYYIFAPTDHVKGGFQGVLRSRSLTGPYEGRDVLDQGATEINGPHQGAWVTTPAGEDWFLHFQDTDSYGRAVLLEPMCWIDDWPIIGKRQGLNGFGQPVLRHRKPNAPATAPAAPVVDDEFADGFHLGWQWNANPGADWVDASADGVLRLKSISSPANLWEAPNLLTQKLPGKRFTATTKLTLAPRWTGEQAGLLVYGYNYGWIGLANGSDGVRLVRATRLKANDGGVETRITADAKVDGPVWLRVTFEPVTVTEPPPVDQPHYWRSMLRSTHARATFSYSLDGRSFILLGDPMQTQPGRWVGAQIGLFAQAPTGTQANVSTRIGWADFDWFRVTP